MINVALLGFGRIGQMVAEKASAFGMDFVSNGVKIRSTSSEVNGDDNTFIYMAFAESPFKNSNGR